MRVLIYGNQVGAELAAQADNLTVIVDIVNLFAFGGAKVLPTVVTAAARCENQGIVVLVHELGSIVGFRKLCA